MAKKEIFLGMSEQAIRQRVVKEAKKYLGVLLNVLAANHPEVQGSLDAFNTAWGA